MNRLERISAMESRLDACHDATGALVRELDRMDALKDGSETWHRDREAKLPEGTKAGVLSEDLVYDEITAVREAAIHMLELATDILKHRI